MSRVLRFLFDFVLILLCEAVWYVIVFLFGFLLMDLVLRIIQ